MAYRPTGRPNGRPRKPRPILAGESVGLDELDLSTRTRPDTVFIRRRLDVLRRSIAEHGQEQAVIVLPDGRLLSGHLRAQVLAELEIATVSVVVVNSQAEAYAALAGEVGEPPPTPWDLRTLVDIDDLVNCLGKQGTLRERADGLRVSLYELRGSRRIMAATRSDNPERVNEALAGIAAHNLGRRTINKSLKRLAAIKPLQRESVARVRTTPAGHSEIDVIMRDIEAATERLKLVRRAEMNRSQAKDVLARIRESQRVLKRADVIVRRANHRG